MQGYSFLLFLMLVFVGTCIGRGYVQTRPQPSLDESSPFTYVSSTVTNGSSIEDILKEMDLRFRYKYTPSASNTCGGRVMV